MAKMDPSEGCARIKDFHDKGVLKYYSTAYQSHDNIFYRLIILRKGLRNFMIEVSGRLQQHTKAMTLSFKRVINLRKSFLFTIFVTKGLTANFTQIM